MGPTLTPAVLMVGHGLIGEAVAARLRAAGQPTVCVARRSLSDPADLALDLASEAGRAALAEALQRLRPDRVVLAHGPSDVTWIEANEAAADAVHCGVATIVARSGAAVLLISTDNVFPGVRSRYRARDPVEPANGYGRVKARTESILLAGTPAALVLRVSLVYGWAGAGQRPTFAQRCLDAAGAGLPMDAPTDQIFTPIHVRDVAAVIAALCGSAAPRTGVAHQAGPTELSRYDFARLAYRLAGADAALVRPCLRRETAWACRPRFSSLACDRFPGMPGGESWRPLTPEQGVRAMLATAVVP